MQCTGRHTLLTQRCSRVVPACVAPQQQPRRISSALRAATPAADPTSAPEPKKAVKAPSPAKTKAVQKKAKVERSLSPYNIFVKANFAAISAQYPEKKGVPEKIVLVSQAWAALSDKDKAPYITAGNKSKAEVSARRAIVQAQQAADAKPLSAYSQFVVDNYPAAKAKNPGMPFIQVSKVVRDMWVAVTPSEKAKYIEEQAAKLAEWKAKQDSA